MGEAARYIVQVEGTAIGAVIISPWDRFNGVAGGPFEPNDQYVPCTHAVLLDGADRQAAILTLVDANGIQLDCDTVAILDNSLSFGNDARDVAIFGVTSLPLTNGG